MNPFRPRHIRITEPGFEALTGYFGTVEFQDGVSTQPVHWQEQQRLGGLVRFVSAEADEESAEIGPAAELLRNRNMDANDERMKAVDTAVMTSDGSIRLAGETYTREELEDIADKRGINGLRDIAKTWGVKGRSVIEVINGILKAQGIQEPLEELPGVQGPGTATDGSN